MKEHGIAIISFGYFEYDFLEQIAVSVRQEFMVPVQLKEGHLDLSEFYDSARRQYNGNQLLMEVDKLYAGEFQKTFGLFCLFFLGLPLSFKTSCTKSKIFFGMIGWCLPS
jgi:archaemetzincin